MARRMTPVYTRSLRWHIAADQLAACPDPRGRAALARWRFWRSRLYLAAKALGWA